MVLFSFVLVGSCLGIFLYYIVNYFQTDKRAYLFEEAYRFGVDASHSFESSAAFGKLLTQSLLEPKDINFQDLQQDIIAIKMGSIKTQKKTPWIYNKTTIKELKLPETDFLGSFEKKETIQFLPTADLQSGYFRMTHHGENVLSIIAIYPKDFFELLNTRKFARVSLVDNSNKTIVFKSPNFPSGFDPIPFSNSDEETKSFDKKLEDTNYFITSHYSKLTNTSMVILYNMDEANATLATLSKTLIWAALGMFGFGLILSTLFARSLAKPLEMLADMSRKVSSGDLAVRVSFKSYDETGLLAASFNNMMDKIQTFIEELKGKARLESELKIASLVQRNFFDLKPMDKPTFSLKGDYITASECAGDWWSVREWNGKFILLLGDATGHGAPSALLTSAVFSAIECIQADITSKENWWKRPDEILYRLNRVIISLSKDIMMTFVVGIYDPETNKIWLSNASHEAPLRYNLSQPPISTKDISFLSCDPGPRLGDNKDPTYFVEEFQLGPLDRILFYTDGLVESLVEPGKNFSDRFLLKRIIKMGSAPLEESFKILLQVPQDCHPNDDISFFIMDIKSSGEKGESKKEIVHEKSFSKSLKTNDFGFMVGNIDSNNLELFTNSLHINWQNALIANLQRSRSQSFDDYISSFGNIRSTVKERLRFAIDELIMNGEMHGKTVGAVQIHLERDDSGFWIKARDVGGNFKQESAEHLYHSIFDEVLTPRQGGVGAGIGLGMILKMSKHVQIYNSPSKETIVSCYIPDLTPENLSSFSYVTIPPQN